MIKSGFKPCDLKLDFDKPMYVVNDTDTAFYKTAEIIHLGEFAIMGKRQWDSDKHDMIDCHHILVRFSHPNNPDHFPNVFKYHMVDEYGYRITKVGIVTDEKIAVNKRNVLTRWINVYTSTTWGHIFTSEEEAIENGKDNPNYRGTIKVEYEE